MGSTNYIILYTLPVCGANTKETMRRCDKWTESDNRYLRDNYQILTNEQIGAIKGRNPDSVRKQLNKLGLMRHKTTEVRKEKKKAQKTFFKNFSQAVTEKKRRQKEERRTILEAQAAVKEKKWADGFMREGGEIPPEPNAEGKVPFRIDHRTVIWIYPHEVEEKSRKWANRQIPK